MNKKIKIIIIGVFLSFVFIINGDPVIGKSNVIKKKKEKKEYSNAKNFSNYSKRKDGYRRSYPSKAKKIGAGKHPPALELADLPKDKFGLINWAAAVRKGKIAPLSSLDPENAEIESYSDQQIVLLTDITFNDVIFPHDIHTYWLNCETCHDQIFKKKRGANKIKMILNKSGKFCGRCHGKVAFPFEDCFRCHVLPKVNFPY